MAKYECPECNSQEFIAVLASRYKFVGEWNGTGEILSRDHVEEIVCAKCNAEAIEVK